MDRPRVGVGVIIQSKNGKILIGKRKGSHAPFYSIPGGHLELGESFEEAASKEVLEETGLVVRNLRVICVTNNLRTYRQEKKHYVSINLYTDEYDGEPQIMEPQKCESWDWYDLNEIPQPHFDASEYAISCFREKKFYIKDQK